MADGEGNGTIPESLLEHNLPVPPKAVIILIWW